MTLRDVIISFSICEMSIIEDDVSCILHLLIRGSLLDHGRINKDEVLVLLVAYQGSDPKEAVRELEATQGAHYWF